MREGDTKAHEFYIVEEGVFVVTAHDHNGQGTVATLGPGRTFGELALMYDVACSQTVTSATEGILWVMQRETYRRVIMTNVVKKRRRYLSFLSAVPLLHGFRRYDLELIADAVEHVVVPAGTDVIYQGDTTTDQFYIIEWGRASVSQKDKYGVTTLCAELGAGDYFGEIAFLTHHPRRVTVKAVCQQHTDTLLLLSAFFFFFTAFSCVLNGNRALSSLTQRKRLRSSTGTVSRGAASAHCTLQR